MKTKKTLVKTEIFPEEGKIVKVYEVIKNGKVELIEEEMPYKGYNVAGSKVVGNMALYGMDHPIFI